MTRLIATFGGVGDLRPAPGTWGSAAALPLGLGHPFAGRLLGLRHRHLRHRRHRLVGGGAGVAGSADKDPSEIVIDEVAGQFVALWPVSFGAMFAGVGFLDLWPGIVTAFLAFRLFDIWKPGPVGWADRQEGALGVMADDLIAGWLAALVVAVFAVIAHLMLIPT
jgi:phosphatidylglycerophosphatase A